MKWYETCHRRHLLDMHIDDWSDEFLSAFSPEEYFRLLKKANVQVAMIYLQSHLGLCYWPSQTGKVHRHFIDKPDDMKKLIDLCRRNGIRVVGYYSLNFNTWAHDQHPDWRMREADGLSRRESDKGQRYGLVCPNNGDYREFVFRQIDEMLAFFELDGIFFDMLFWEHICYCPSCRDRYRRERGRFLPLKGECTQEEWLDFFDSRAYWIGDWANAVTDYVHRIAPDLPVEHNFSASTGGFDLCCRDLVNEACEYVGGDRYGGQLEQSFVCKCYYDLSKHLPFEYMTGRCVPNLLAHTVTKTEDKLEQQILHTFAHHGAFLAIDAIDPVGTMDERFYTLLGKIYGKAAGYEPHMTGDLTADVGIFYNFDSGANLQEGDTPSKAFLHFGGSQRTLTNWSAAEQALKHLVKAHIPCGITTKGHTDRWGQYRVIIAPNVNRLDEQTVDALIAYVAGGGCLYMSGCDETRLLETLVGGRYRKHLMSTRAYVFPSETGEALFEGYNEKYPLPLDTGVPIVEGIPEKNVLAYLKLAYTSREVGYCASIHSDPPGVATDHPALVETTYGKGKVLWSAGALEFHQPSDYGRILQNLLRHLDSRPYAVSSTAAGNVEIITFRDRNKVRVSAVNLSDEDTLYTIPDFTVTVRSEQTPLSVTRLSDGTALPFTAGDGEVTFPVSGVRIMDMFEIIFEEE